MENKIVIGNMKMNMTIDEITEYLKKINNEIHSDRVVLCPSALYIPYFLKHDYHVGIQNIAPAEKGAYTGEISAMQASYLGVSYAIIGHSERRQIFKEDNVLIHQKIIEAVRYNLRVILCIGETKEQHSMLKTNVVLKRQLIDALRELEPDMLENITIAYEPVWAIGTGEIPANKEIHDTVEYIKGIVELHCHKTNIPVLYGGSINDKNIKTLNQIDNLSGFLVGGACLDPDKWKHIIEVAVP